MTDPRRIGILGGTFDPIHLGHVAIADVAREAVMLDRVLFVPAHVPPHRAASPIASAQHRFAMVTLALAGHDRLIASDLELRSSTPSYTVTTLQRLADTDYAPLQLFFIIGADAFAEIASWHGYPELLDCAHFIVVSRPGHEIDDLHRRFPTLQERIHNLGDVGHMMPTPVRSTLTLEQPMILLIGAPTPDVSSREVRRRLADGEPLGDCVSPEVEAYIVRHRLYGALSDGR